MSSFQTFTSGSKRGPAVLLLQVCISTEPVVVVATSIVKVSICLPSSFVVDGRGSGCCDRLADFGLLSLVSRGGFLLASDVVVFFQTGSCRSRMNYNVWDLECIHYIYMCVCVCVCSGSSLI